MWTAALIFTSLFLILIFSSGIACEVYNNYNLANRIFAVAMGCMIGAFVCCIIRIIMEVNNVG